MEVEDHPRRPQRRHGPSAQRGTRRRLASCLLAAGAIAGVTGIAAQEADTPLPAASQPDGFDQEAALVTLRERIEGREGEPSEMVFENIRTLEGVPAGRLLRIMELGFSRSLGATCTHCHDPRAWEKDDVSRKGVARRMWGTGQT